MALIDQAQAADLRARLATFAEEWENPEMSIYDNYDTAKSKLIISKQVYGKLLLQ